MTMPEAGRRLDNWLMAYLRYTEKTEPPTAFHYWTALSVLAGAMERKCWIPWGGMFFYPNLYVVLVGPSGARKSGAMHFGKELLYELRLPMGPNSATKEALVETQMEARRECKDHQGRTRSHSSLTIVSSELQALLGTKDTEFLSWMCDWFDSHYQTWGRPWTYRTRKKGIEEIYGICLNMLGGTTPDLIEEMMPVQVITSGFSARVIWVWASGRKQTDPRTKMSDQELMLRGMLIDDLKVISKMSGGFHKDPEADEFFTAWYTKQNGAPPIVAGKRFEGYNERRPMYWLKLSMICSAARGDSKIITMKDINQALGYLKPTEMVMAKVFDQFGMTPVARITNDILEEIRIKGCMTTKDINASIMDYTLYKSVINTLYQHPLITAERREDICIFHYGGMTHGT